MKKHLIILLALATACTKDPEVGSPAPHVEILAHTELLRTSVTLNCKLEGSNLSSIKEFCFKIGNNSSLKDAQIYPLSKIVAGEHTMTVKNLDIGGTYFYAVCISNGLNTITSEVRALTTQTTSPALVGELSLQTGAGITASASVEETGGGQIETCGFCWKISPQPTIYDQNMRTTLQPNNSFSGVLRELVAGQNYYIRAFVQNTSGISYSNEVYVSTSPEPGESVVPIPDAAFKAYLVENFDKDGDGEISIKEAAEVRSIEVQTTQIESLSGISYFTGLTTLRATGSRADQTRGLAPATGKLRQLNLTKNTELLHLYLENNQIEAFDVQANTKLTTLSIYNNPIIWLELRSNPALQSLDCWNCSALEVLDLRDCTSLTSLFAADCNLTTNGILDLSSCNKLTRLDVTNNPRLSTIKMWPGFDEASNVQFRKDDTASYVVTSDFPEFPDPNFRAFVQQYDTDRDGKVSFAEAAAVTGRMEVNTDNIISLEGIEWFVNIEELVCKGKGDAVTGSLGKLETLDVSKNTNLTTLDCSFNQLSSLDVSKNTNLTTLDCIYNQLSNLDVSKNATLTYLACMRNQLNSLDVSKNANLTRLDCGANLQLSHLDVSKNANLTTLLCGTCRLSSLDVSKNAKLITLNCSINGLNSLDLTNNRKLQLLQASSNNFGTIDISKNLELTYLSLRATGLSGGFDISNNTKLTTFEIESNPNLKTIYVWSGFNIADYPYFKKDDTAEYVVKGASADIIDIPDANFKAYLVQQYDTNKDGKISQTEAAAVSGMYVNTNNILSLEGIEWFVNIEVLSCEGTYADDRPLGTLQTLDVSKNIKLTTLSCRINKLSSLDVSQNTNLKTLYCDRNQLSSLSVNKGLTHLSVEFNRLTTLQIAHCTDLSGLSLGSNNLTEIDVSKYAKLEYLDCSSSSLSSLDITHNSLLKSLRCNNNTLRQLDITKNPKLQELYCGWNRLSSLDVTNNPDLRVLSTSGTNGFGTIDVSKNLELQTLDISLTGITGSFDISNNTKLTTFEIESNPNLKTIYVWNGFNAANYPKFKKDDTAEYVVKSR